jgi:hypothetical protein
MITIPDERLHQNIFDLSERRRAGDRSCDGLLGRLLDEMDRRGDAEEIAKNNQPPATNHGSFNDGK